MLQSEERGGVGLGHAVQVCLQMTVGVMVNFSPVSSV